MEFEGERRLGISREATESNKGFKLGKGSSRKARKGVLSVLGSVCLHKLSLVPGVPRHHVPFLLLPSPSPPPLYLQANYCLDGDQTDIYYNQQDETKVLYDSLITYPLLVIMLTS